MLSVSKWYSGKHIFITGGTGFMGKVLVEKLLRSCPEISAIYLLIRNKQEKTPKQRIEEFTNTAVFDKIRDRPESKKLFPKIHYICGDLLLNNFNLSNNDVQLLQDNVDVVFHMAADVRFNQGLKESMLINTGATLSLLEMALSFRKLKALVHVSTTYCHCHETVLEEKLYPPPHNPRKILELVNWMDEDLLKLLSPGLLKNSPNFYAYTKCLTEHLVAEYGKHFPIAIVRPATVTAAYREPLPGWVDSINHLVVPIVGIGKGLVHTIYCNPSLEVNIIPVDISINALILIAKELGQKTNVSEAMVYNLSHDLKWGHVFEMVTKHILDNPFSTCFWYPRINVTSNYPLYIMGVFSFQLIPSYFIDFLLRLLGKRPLLVRVQKRMLAFFEVTGYYTTRPWKLLNSNINDVAGKLSESDKNIFYTDMSSINWNRYILDYVLGVRKYCLHENPESIPSAKKKLRRLYFLKVVTNITFYSGVLWILFTPSVILFDATEPLGTYLTSKFN